MRSAPCSVSPVNFDSLNDHALKVRERDFMRQVRIGIGTLRAVWPNGSQAADCPGPPSSVAALLRGCEPRN